MGESKLSRIQARDKVGWLIIFSAVSLVAAFAVPTLVPAPSESSPIGFSTACQTLIAIAFSIAALSSVFDARSATEMLNVSNGEHDDARCLEKTALFLRRSAIWFGVAVVATLLLTLPFSI